MTSKRGELLRFVLFVMRGINVQHKVKTGLSKERQIEKVSTKKVKEKGDRYSLDGS